MDYFDILLAKKLSGGGGGEITVEGLNVEENGTYTAPTGKAYSPVVVNLPLDEKTITANGEYLASADDLKGYSKVTVNVAGFTKKAMPTGAIASFNDGTANPLTKLKIAINPVQAGSGDPSPTNPRAISGWTEANVNVSGINTWNEQWEVGGINTSGDDVPNTDRIRSKDYILCKANTTYYLKTSLSTNEIRISYYDKDKTFISQTGWLYNGVFTTPANAYYLRFNSSSVYGNTYLNDISINYPSTDTTYHAYVGSVVPVSWQTEAGTVYGGELDVTSGTGVKTHVKVDLGTLNWSKNTETETYQDWRSNSIASLIKAIPITEIPIAWCEEYEVIRRGSQTSPYTIGVTSAGNLVIYTNPNEYASGDDLKTALNGVNFVYELATPTDFTFNPTSVKSLLGTNNIWADTGDVLEGEYFTSL